jgi:membrane-associated protease RseP (regulator of RpoE activity)
VSRIPTLLRAVPAAVGLASVAPGALAAQQTPAAGTVVPRPARPATGVPCSDAAPTRTALRLDEARVRERATIELRAAELRLAEARASEVRGATGGGGGAAEGGMGARARQPRFSVARVLQPQGYLGLRTAEISDIRITPLGRVVRYCSYPVVVTVEPASPADRAGIEKGDTIVAYNDRDLVKGGELELDRLLVPGETVRVRLRRDGRTHIRPIVVGTRQITGFVRTWSDARGSGVVVISPDGTPLPAGRSEGRWVATFPTPRPGARTPMVGAVSSTPATPSAPLPPVVTSVPVPAAAPVPGFTVVYGSGTPTPLLGAQLVSLDDDLREVLDVREGAGVFVLRVVAGTHAFDAGLRSGDVIRSANGTPVVSPLAISRVLATASHLAGAHGAEERALRLEIERKGQRKTVTLRW